MTDDNTRKTLLELRGGRELVVALDYEEVARRLEIAWGWKQPTVELPCGYLTNATAPQPPVVQLVAVAAIERAIPFAGKLPDYDQRATRAPNGTWAGPA